MKVLFWKLFYKFYNPTTKTQCIIRESRLANMGYRKISIGSMKPEDLHGFPQYKK